MLLGVSCAVEDPFQRLVSDYALSVKSGVDWIELSGVDSGWDVLTLEGSLSTTNSMDINQIVSEIVFVDDPNQPREMGHSSKHASCKMLMHCRNGKVICIYVKIKKHTSITGAEFAIHDGVDLSSIFESKLPGNNSLGRGYSLRLPGMIQTLLNDAGKSWVMPAPAQ